MAELKPCPFCGSEIIECYLYDRKFGIERHKVCCFKCSAQFYRGTKKEAIEAWNRRTTIETNIYDQEETYPNCTVQVLTNTVTGETSVGWWKNPPSGIDFDYEAED